MDWMIERGRALLLVLPLHARGPHRNPADLMPTPEQRERMYRFVREMREKKPLFTLDFQNDGEFVGGCIAGGRRYLHINAAGDVEPCVFIHYSNANIHDVSLLDALRSPALHEVLREPCRLTTNYLKPCPMLENPDVPAANWSPQTWRTLRTDLIEKESPEQLREKTEAAAAAWAPVAERLWADEADPMHETRRRWNEGQATTDVSRLGRLGRDLTRQPEPRL